MQEHQGRFLILKTHLCIFDSQITALKSIFNLNVVSKYEKHLGLPSMISKKKSSFFKDIKLEVLNKFAGIKKGSRMEARKFS